jgi:hypothetical protein
MMTCLAACLLAADARNASEPPISWDQKAAAAYLDGREGWWMNWPRAGRDHETFCVSCHTAAESLEQNKSPEDSSHSCTDQGCLLCQD